METHDPLTLCLTDIGWTTDNRSILNGVSLTVASGEMVGLIGPNGSGKSSLLRCVYRYLRPTRGAIYLNGTDVNRMSRVQTAKTMAAVLQERASSAHVSVLDVVLMGRLPHKRRFDGDTPADHRLALTALAMVGMMDFVDRHFHSLSGGERQRVLLARALCQQARLLILDEPTNHLDIRHQLEILARVKQLRLAILVALHDLNIAAAFCDRLIILSKGLVVAQGDPPSVLTERMIEAVYGIAVKVGLHPQTGTLNIAFVPPQLTKRTGPFSVDGRPR